MKVLLLAIAVIGMTSACDSNPTPHPGQDAARDDAYTGGAGDTTPSNFGPDDDGDGVADCFELDGTWDGESCQVPTGSPDASDGGDVDEADVVDGDPGDGGPVDGEGDAQLDGESGLDAR